MNRFIFLLSVLIPTLCYSQEFEKGKELFQINCAGCHNMEKRVLGPALENTIEQQGRDWTSRWISNNTELRASGDAHANEVFKEYNQQIMPAFDYLKPEELNALLDYMEGFKKDKESKTPVVTPSTDTPNSPNIESNTYHLPTYSWIFIILTLGILIVSAIVIVTSLRLLDSHFAKLKVTNSHLTRKMKLNENDVDEEVELIFEREVMKRVNEKVKTLRTDIDDRLKDFK